MMMMIIIASLWEEGGSHPCAAVKCLCCIKYAIVNEDERLIPAMQCTRTALLGFSLKISAIIELIELRWLAMVSLGLSASLRWW